MKSLKISCFGAGFVGIPTLTVLACHNEQADFVIYDIDKNKIKQCKQGKLPIFQPQLQQTILKVLNKNLIFTDIKNDALDNVDIIFLALPTPTKLFGQQKGKAYDLSYTQNAIRQIVNYYNQNQMKDQVILVEKSTVPIGTAKMITDIIFSNSIPANKRKYTIVSNPQFLAEGSAINDLQHPDRVVIGSKKQDQIQNLISLYHYVSTQKIILTNQYSSQLSKLVANCFLAQRVSSINSIAILCQQTQADVDQIKKCISTDSRIGTKFLNSSVGFGGSCFKKDMLALIYLAQCKGLKQVANYWKAVIQMNQYRKKNFFINIFKAMNNNLLGKKLAVFGTAFKKDTCDPRQSPALVICDYLLSEGAILNVYDPKTSLQNFIKQMKYHQLWKQSYQQKMIQFNNPDQSIINTHAIVILTQWDSFKQCNYQQYYNVMEKPSFIFDGRHILEQQKIKSIGFRYYRIGKQRQKNY